MDNWEKYGESITAKDALNATEAIAHFTEEGKKIKVQGTVTAICDKVGCWAQFITGNDQKSGLNSRTIAFLFPPNQPKTP